MWAWQARISSATVYPAYDMPASTAHCDQITTSSPNSILDKLTFNLRRTLRAHVLIIQISNLLLLRCAERCGIRRPCILSNNIQICIPRGRGRWRRRGAWSSAHPALLSVDLTTPIDVREYSWLNDRRSKRRSQWRGGERAWDGVRRCYGNAMLRRALGGGERFGAGISCAGMGVSAVRRVGRRCGFGWAEAVGPMD